MKTKQDVMTWAELQPTLGAAKLATMRIAVAGLIFDDAGRILLNCRGEHAADARGCLEGIGGSLDQTEYELEPALKRELGEEVQECQIAIERFLVCSHLRFLNIDGEWHDWAIVTFLCRLLSGTPRFVEVNQMVGLGWFEPEQFASWSLEERRTVQLVNAIGETVTTEAGLSIWVPEVLREYHRQRDGALPAGPTASVA